MTNSDYHARAEISKSDLSLLASKTPYALKLKKEGLLPSEQTPSLLLGSVIHKLVLEPLTFSHEYAVMPECDKRTKEGKAIFAEFEAKSAGKTIITHEIFDKAKAIAKSVTTHKAFDIFVNNGMAEQSYFSEINGVKVKCRPDFYNEKLGLLVDLKTAQSVKKYDFTKSIANYAYDMQVAFYTDILESLGKAVNSFLFIAVETKEPYGVAFYEIKRNSPIFESGRQYYTRLLAQWSECVANDSYPNYEREINENGDEIIVQEITDLPTYELIKRG
ncbi:PD-(D/E)XK nuclease-like domain-containing protein [Campylobacter sp. VBCF_06 NA8]|uniref:PD-(D/E)XK nuclease-like domain-containing protein n=1 Tax=Campylobacter sp. VBCF_06 NA8 TaxID=2983822 RepID=UPI0022E9B637|nr:PD-(D/E)XK nuclease-like domain-containing protein [Campylobacter sp. VBCF_06 NA8]MDA3046729.1 PD-(D/E)XK nuclease-like domain-containing protein [Campylobacter sp. VBCF_06 NA8]